MLSEHVRLEVNQINGPQNIKSSPMELFCQLLALPECGPRANTTGNFPRRNKWHPFCLQGNSPPRCALFVISMHWRGFCTTGLLSMAIYIIYFKQITTGNFTIFALVYFSIHSFWHFLKNCIFTNVVSLTFQYFALHTNHTKELGTKLILIEPIVWFRTFPMQTTWHVLFRWQKIILS